jgi:hypothetical protein
MRTTVGPLPPAVYWRRRAVVLGALLLGVIVLFVSCSGGGKDPDRGKGASAQFSAPAQTSSTPDDEPSFSDAQPGGGPSLPDPDDLTSPGTGTGTGTSAGLGTVGQNGDINVTAPADGSCSDAEVSVTPVPAATTVKRGTPLEIRLKIKNIGTRTCNRDVGAGAQELYIDLGAQKIWSSDTCSNANQADVKQMSPGAEREYLVTWNGRMTTKCSGGLAIGPAPNPGQYEVRGRLASKISNPVTLRVVA